MSDSGGSVEFDQYGTPLCPLTHGEVEWSEDGNTSTIVQKPCRAEMALIVSLRITPGQGDPVVRSRDFTEANAVTSQWEYECLNGHVLATSCEEETAEDFTWLASQSGRS